MNEDSKLRLLYIAKLLYDETDEQHYLSTSQIMKELKDRWNISSHRTTIPADIEALIQFGIEIEIVKSSQTKYCLLSRTFDLPELKLLIDTVKSSRFLTRKKTDELVCKLTELTSRPYANTLKRNLYSETKLKKANEKIYYIIETVNEAINQKKKISFYYFNYNLKKQRELKNNGNPYIFSPYYLVWNGDYYYTVGYCEKHKSICSYRIDRIEKQPELLTDKAKPMPKGFSLSKFTDSMFRMYNTERKSVQLICNNSVMDSVIDKFGTGIKTSEYDNDHFTLNVDIAVNHIFYSWIFGFGGLVKIKEPADIREEYQQMLRNALDNF